jgi:hypothetical protein
MKAKHKHFYGRSLRRKLASIGVDRASISSRFSRFPQCPIISVLASPARKQLQMLDLVTTMKGPLAKPGPYLLFCITTPIASATK